METSGLKIKFFRFKQMGLGLFFLLLSLQLQLLLALPQNPMVAGGKHEMRAIGRRGGAVGCRGGGGEHDREGDAYGDKGGSSTKSTDRRGGALIPVYAAGSKNHNRYRHSHGSSSGTLNCVGSSCLVLILYTSFFCVASDLFSFFR